MKKVLGISIGVLALSAVSFKSFNKENHDIQTKDSYVLAASYTEDEGFTKSRTTLKQNKSNTEFKKNIPTTQVAESAESVLDKYLQ